MAAGISASILRAEVAVAGPRSQPSFRASNNWMAEKGLGDGEDGLQWPDCGFIGVHCFSGSVMCMCWCYVVCRE
jgi:hypothetical protein